MPRTLDPKRARKNLIKSRVWLADYQPDLRDRTVYVDEDLAEESVDAQVRSMRSLTSSSAMALRRPSQRRL